MTMVIFSVVEGIPKMVSKDIYRVSKLLDHSGISVTEGYLRSLKVFV
jgi:hypothetical protein